jgi:hypothetical protein
MSLAKGLTMRAPAQPLTAVGVASNVSFGTQVRAMCPRLFTLVMRGQPSLGET